MGSGLIFFVLAWTKILSFDPPSQAETYALIEVIAFWNAVVRV